MGTATGRAGAPIARPRGLAGVPGVVRSVRRVDLVAATPGVTPAQIVLVSGDIHFSYAARVERFAGAPGPEVRQVVSSPIRNALIPHKRGAMRFAITRAGGVVGSKLRRASRGGDTRPGLAVEAGPYFANNMCMIDYGGDSVVAVFKWSTTSDTGDDHVLTEVGRVSLRR